MLSAEQALTRLRDGNRRFVSGEGGRDLTLEHGRRVELVEDQAPVAIVLGCSDSRVPAELVFDQGLGDLFVIRVAGNIVAPSQLGSIEFAAERIGVRLVVVLGHTRCGVIAASVESLGEGAEGESPNLGCIVDRVRHALQPLHQSVPGLNRDELIRSAVRENVRASARQLRSESDILRRLIREEGLLVVGAEYALETGKVEFFDGPD